MRIARIIISFAALAAVLLLSSVFGNENREYIIHTVTPGETVSLICIDYYAHYSPEMGKAVSSLNPSVKNIDIIYPGQKIKLKNPSFTASGDSSPAIQTVSALETKTGVTQGVVTWVEGVSYITCAGTIEKKKLKVNTVVEAGDTLETGKNGRIELIVNREQVVRLKPFSRIAVSSFRNDDAVNSTTRMNCTIGTVWAKVKKFSDRMSRFQMELPNAVAGVHGTVYEASVQPDKSAEVKVYDGEVGVDGVYNPPEQQSGVSEVEGPHEIEGPHEVSLEEWTRIVGAMQKIRISNRGEASETESFSAAAGAWEKWNEERDRRIAEMFAREF